MRFILVGFVTLIMLVPGSSPWTRRITRGITDVVRKVTKPVTCTQSVCTTTYKWQPGLRQGQCIQQVGKASHAISKTTLPVGTCRNKGCGANDIKRTRCSCAEIQTCQWANWGSWSGHVADGACAKQSRTRLVNKSFRYLERANNCNGVKSDCLAQVKSDSQHRTFCRCKKTTKCQTSAWSSWSPFPGNGKCGKQTSRRKVTPQHTIATKLNNCHGITSTCSLVTSKDRQYCSCPYKQCDLQSWTGWVTTNKLNPIKCPVEERKRHYKSTVKYTHAFNNCNTIGPQTCAASLVENRDKQLSCPTMSTPADGKLNNDVCKAAKSRCGSICQMSCNQGYKRKGNPYATCNKNAQWDRPLAICQDHVPPQITCPLDKEYETLPNKNYTIIHLPSASATDNTGLPPTITMNQKSSITLAVQQPRDVIYTATDKARNKVTCKTIVEVIDNDPPKVVHCPTDLTVTPPAFPYPVIWKEPEFLDNVDGKHVIKYPTHHNGQAFSEGLHHVRILARDRSNNNATCEFSVQVSKAICPDHNPPRHGSKSCNVHRSGKNETYVCSVACDTGHHFPNLPTDVKVYDFYVCGEEGNWRGQDKFDPINAFFVQIPRDQRPWPECARIKGVNSPVNGGSGGCVSDEEKELIKQDFINSLKADRVLSSIYCSSGIWNNCVTSNVVVTCDAANDIKVVFNGKSAVIAKKVLGTGIPPPRPTISPVNMNKLRSLLAKLTQRKNQEKKMKEMLAKCDSGAILKTSSSGKEECLVCPVGTYHDIKGNACVNCPIGTYQSDDGSTECVACAAGFSTIATAAKNETDCKAICYPGSFSPTGLSTCLACRIGFYQPNRGQKSCLKCPSGKTTSVVGSGLASDCV